MKMLKEFLEEEIEDAKKEYQTHLENHCYAEMRITNAKLQAYERVLATIKSLERSYNLEINL